MVSYEISVIQVTPLLEIFPYQAIEGEELVPEDAYAEEETEETSSINVAYVAPEEE